VNLVQPDLAAPGADILAAWSQGNTVTGLQGDRRVVRYNIISGTSMACPHATGAAAYIKSFHPTWSPAAIKSALMTTGNDFTKGYNLQMFLYMQENPKSAKVWGFLFLCSFFHEC